MIENLGYVRLTQFQEDTGRDLAKAIKQFRDQKVQGAILDLRNNPPVHAIHLSTDCDVLVTGTSKQARFRTLTLVKAAKFNGVDAGPIENSAVVEGLSSVLIHINKQYHSKKAGIKITGIPIEAQENKCL